MSKRGLPVIARQFHERLSIAEMQFSDPEPNEVLVCRKQSDHQPLALNRKKCELHARETR
jgi:hypothetical protein